MSNVTPINPIAPIPGGFDFSLRPYAGIRPFTMVWGRTHQDTLEDLRKYVHEALAHVNTENEELNKSIQAVVNNLIVAFNGKIKEINELDDAINDKVDDKIDDLITQVNLAVQQVVTSSIVLQDPVLRGILNNPVSTSRTLLDALYVTPAQTYTRAVIDDLASAAQRVRSRGVLSIHNVTKIDAWGRLLVNKDNPMITVVGDSLVEGIGTDDTSDGVNYESMRNYSWASILGRRYGAMRNVRPAPGFVGALPAFGFSSVRAGVPVVGSTFGPFGGYGTDNSNNNGLDRRRGGYGLPKGADWANDSGETGFFTNLWICSFGPDSGISAPRAFGLEIDGIETIPVPVGDVNQAGFMTYTKIPGLGATRHSFKVKGSGNSGNTPYYGAIVFNDKQVIVNRIGAAGATTDDLVGTAIGGTGADRILNASILFPETDLLIILCGYNDWGKGLPIADARAKIKTNLQKVITRQLSAGGSKMVLMVSPPPGGNTVDNSVYRELSDENARTAYLDMTPVFGPKPLAYADGLFPSANTVHMSRYGNQVYGDMLFNSLPAPFLN